MFVQLEKSVLADLAVSGDGLITTDMIRAFAQVT